MIVFQVTYELVGGNETELFRLDSKTGGIFVTRPLSKTTSMYHINVSAKDGAGLRQVFLNILYNLPSEELKICLKVVIFFRKQWYATMGMAFV